METHGTLWKKNMAQQWKTMIQPKSKLTRIDELAMGDVSSLSGQELRRAPWGARAALVGFRIFSAISADSPFEDSHCVRLRGERTLLYLCRFQCA